MSNTDTFTLHQNTTIPAQSVHLQYIGVAPIFKLGHTAFARGSLEISMISFKVLGAAALLALAPAVIVVDTASAQFNPRGGGRPSAGNFNAGRAAAFAGRPAFQAPRPGPSFAGRPNFGGGRPAFAGGGRRFIGPGIGFAAGVAAGAAIAARPSYGYGGGYRYGGGGYGYSSGYGYGGGYPVYSDNSYAYADPDYVDGSVVAVEPQVEVQADTGGDSVEYCRQTYRSYDPRSGTYLGYDGNRYACP